MRRFFLAVAAAAFFLPLHGYLEATSDPIVRRASLAVAGYPAGEPPVRIVLISDIHVSGPDMPPARVARIVRQVNALAPDVVLIAGDFISDKPLAMHRYTSAEAVAPLAGLRARLGIAAVLGNHDYGRGPQPIIEALRNAGIVVLRNEAHRFGPLAIGAVDDPYAGVPDVPATVAAMRATGGVPVIFTHSPDNFPQIPPDIALTLAGHTHCGQITLPWFGPLFTSTNVERRYGCGMVRDGERTLIVTAGLGTSLTPLRIGARPDLWLVDLRGRQSVRVRNGVNPVEPS